MTIKTIKKLLESNNKITIKVICEKSNLSNKTVIKYYQSFKEDIKKHNQKIKIEIDEINDIVKNCI